MDYEFFAILLPEKADNKCTLATDIPYAYYFCYQKHFSCKLSLFCPILAKNWNVSIYLRVDPKFEILQKHFIW